MSELSWTRPLCRASKQLFRAPEGAMCLVTVPTLPKKREVVSKLSTEVGQCHIPAKTLAAVRRKKCSTWFLEFSMLNKCTEYSVVWKWNCDKLLCSCANKFVGQTFDNSVLTVAYGADRPCLIWTWLARPRIIEEKFVGSLRLRQQLKLNWVAAASSVTWATWLLVSCEHWHSSRVVIKQKNTCYSELSIA